MVELNAGNIVNARCCPGWTSVVSDSDSRGARGAFASPAQLRWMGQNWCGLIRTWKITTLLLSLPRAVVFEQPKPRGFSTRGLCWRAPGSARAGGSAGTRGNGVPEPCPLRLCFPLRTDRESGLSEKNTNSQPFRPDSPCSESSAHIHRGGQEGTEAPCGMRPEAASRGEASAWRGAGERPRELPGATRACGQQKGRLDDQWSASWNVDIPMQSCHLNTSCARNRQSFQGSSAVSRQVQAPGDLFKQKAGARGAPCAQRRTSLPEESQFFSEAQQ
ncbi:uncharacterized protein M8220_005783 isoform 2-T2 [Acridotheres tristis]